MIRVIAIDDHIQILALVTNDIDSQDDMHIVGTTNHSSKMNELVRETSPDVLILDLGMIYEEFEPISAVQQLLREYPNLKVLILTGNDSLAYIRDLIKAGAMGYVFKFEDLCRELPKAVRAIYSGQRFYSPAATNILLAGNDKPSLEFNDRELQVLRLLADGYQNERIGELVGITGKWVRNILSEVYNKLDIPSELNQRVVAVNKARKLGLIPDK